MKPRGFWATFAFIGVVSGIGFAFLLSLFYSFTTGQSFIDLFINFGLLAGLGFGLLFGFVMAFLLKAESVVLPVRDPVEFNKMCSYAMNELHYTPAGQVGQTLTFKPTFQAGILGWNIIVQVEADRATFTGPKMLIKKLHRWIR